MSSLGDFDRHRIVDRRPHIAPRGGNLGQRGHQIDIGHRRRGPSKRCELRSDLSDNTAIEIALELRLDFLCAQDASFGLFELRGNVSGGVLARVWRTT